jgi:hypothetical protein
VLRGGRRGSLPACHEALPPRAHPPAGCPGPDGDAGLRAAGEPVRAQPGAGASPDRLRRRLQLRLPGAGARADGPARGRGGDGGLLRRVGSGRGRRVPDLCGGVPGALRRPGRGALDRAPWLRGGRRGALRRALRRARRCGQSAGLSGSGVSTFLEPRRRAGVGDRRHRGGGGAPIRPGALAPAGDAAGVRPVPGAAGGRGPGRPAGRGAGPGLDPAGARGGAGPPGEPAGCAGRRWGRPVPVPALEPGRRLRAARAPGRRPSAACAADPHPAARAGGRARRAPDPRRRPADPRRRAPCRPRPCGGLVGAGRLRPGGRHGAGR